MCDYEKPKWNAEVIERTDGEGEGLQRPGVTSPEREGEQEEKLEQVENGGVIREFLQE